MAEQDGRSWWPWDVWLAHRRLSAAWWPTPDDVRPRFNYQRLVDPPPPARRATRDPLDIEAERELLRRILGT